jgi:hypothetical protein
MKIVTLLISAMMALTSNPEPTPIKGAWISEKAGITTIRIYTDGFFAVSTHEATRFLGTYGGSYKLNNEQIAETIEFDSQNPERIGTQLETEYHWRAQEEEINFGEKSKGVRFVRLDIDSPGKLAGAWLITGRYNNGEMSKITPGARRTMKILSGTRFQWIAYNVETKEFFGTGGGKYTTENGKYTETIEFFSRDQSRVGMSLGFDFSLTPEGAWRHSGKSSKGDPIDEIWTQREKLGM